MTSTSRDLATPDLHAEVPRAVRAGRMCMIPDGVWWAVNVWAPADSGSVRILDEALAGGTIALRPDGTTYETSAADRQDEVAR